MDSVRVIRFETEGGVTSFTMPMDDPRVATLLSMYDLHSVPDVVELKGSVSKIVDEEYEAFSRMITRSEVLKRTIATERVRMILGEDLSTFTAEDHDDLRLDDIQAPRLHEVLDIARIFDVEGVDLLGVLIDKDTPQAERMAYHRKVGRWLFDNGHTRLLKLYTRKCCCTNAMMIGLLQVVAVIANGARAPLGEYEDAAHCILSIVYSSIIASREEGQGAEWLPEKLMWDDLIEIAKGYNEDDSIEMNTLRLMADKGDLEAQVYIHFVDIQASPPPVRQFVYERVIRLLPANVDPGRLGLWRVINPQGCLFLDQSQLMTIISFSLARQMGTLYDKDSITALRSKEKMRQLEQDVGRYTLCRILISFLHYENAGNGNKRTKTFIRAIEKHLG